MVPNMCHAADLTWGRLPVFRRRTRVRFANPAPAARGIPLPAWSLRCDRRGRGPWTLRCRFLVDREAEAFALDSDGDLGSVLDLTVEDQHRQLVGDLLLDHPLERPGTEGRVIADLGQ